MNKLKYLLLLLSINSFSISFFNKDFNVFVKETGNNIVKEYKLDYKPNEIVLEVLSPKINKGEIYTYKNDKKYIYYPSLDETIEQTYANAFNDIILSLKVLKTIDKTTIKDNVKYIVKNDKIERIEGENFNIVFYYTNNKITKIIFNSDEQKRVYEWKY